MPTYEYECESCQRRFEREQRMSDPPVAQCPECAGPVHRVISAGGGFIIKGPSGGSPGGACGFTTTGRTCCGSTTRCAEPPCGSKP